MTRRAFPGAPLVVSLAFAAACGGQSEATRGAEAMKAATANRVQADGSLRLTDQDRSALGLVVQPTTEADLPNTSLRLGRITSPPAMPR